MTKHFIDPDCGNPAAIKHEGHWWCEPCYSIWQNALQALNELDPATQELVVKIFNETPEVGGRLK